MRRIAALSFPILLILATAGCGPGEQAPSKFPAVFYDFQTSDSLDAWAIDPASDQAAMRLAEDDESDGRWLELTSQGEEKDIFRALLTLDSRPPEDAYLKLSGRVRSTAQAGLSLIADTPDPEGPRSAGSSIWQNPTPPDGEWHDVEVKIHVPVGAERLRIGCVVRGPGEAAFDDLSIEPTGWDFGIRQTLEAPGIARAVGADDFQADRAVERFEVTFPLPLMTEYQCPLNFVIEVDPPDRLISWEIVHRSGPNRVCRLVLGPFEKEEIIKLRYGSDVLLTAADFSGIPEKAAVPGVVEYPGEVLPWLEETISVQKDHVKIAAAAEKILEKSGENDAIAYIREMLAFIRPIEFGQPEGCDAVSMLEQGGACTSHANLGAALCRRVGIPARVIANYPTWNTALQTHYTIEAYISGCGWVPVETAMYDFPHDPFRQINMSRVTIPDENDSFEENRMAAPGVPRWSLNEHFADAGIRTIGAPLNAAYCDHIASPRIQFRQDRHLGKALALARKIWSAYLESRGAGSENTRLTDALEKRLEPVPDSPKALLKNLREIETRLD